MRRHWEVVAVIIAVLGVLFLAALAPEPARAIPAFARKYNTSCTTCHVDFPKLNDFGKAFKDAGFKFPTDDESFIKVPPVMLGAPAQKDLFPRVVWPGVIDGLPPVSLRMNNFFQVTGKNVGQFNTLVPAGTPAPFVPRTDFESGFFSMFTAGNFGSDIAFWVDDDISVAGANANGGLGDAYLRFVNVGRFLHMPKDSLHLRVGQFELDLPFSQARNINISPYDIYSQANIGAQAASFNQQNVSNAFTFAGAAQGVELSGGHLYGGYHYSLAIVNQVTGTQSVDPGTFVGSATGSSSGGVGFVSDANYKDLYGRLSYRFNLEQDKSSRTAIQAAGATGPRDHTYINIGSFGYYGRSVQRLAGELADGTPVVLTAREPFYRVGGDLSFNYRTFNIYGLYMYGHDHNLMPIDNTGAILALPVSGGAVPVGFIRGTPTTFGGGFIQADYLVVPWIMAIMRVDGVNSTADRLNGMGYIQCPPGTAGCTTPTINILGSAVSPSFMLPYHRTRTRITPGVQFLIHANIKASFEYQIRPQQVVTIGTSSTGLPVPVSPFRVNTAVIALEYVY